MVDSIFNSKPASATSRPLSAASCTISSFSPTPHAFFDFFLRPLPASFQRQAEFYSYPCGKLF